MARPPLTLSFRHLTLSLIANTNCNALMVWTISSSIKIPSYPLTNKKYDFLSVYGAIKNDHLRSYQFVISVDQREMRYSVCVITRQSALYSAPNTL